MAEKTFDEAAVAAAWNRNAALWTEEVRSGFDFYRELYTFPAFLDFMPDIAGRRVIDLGCGEGSNTRRFAKLGGLDDRRRHLGGDDPRARQREEEEPLGIAYHISSFSDLSSFADAQFDCALSTHGSHGWA